VIAQVHQHNEEVARQYAELKHALAELHMSDVLPSESKFMWAIASIHSRTIYTGADQVGALCPFADLFNHSADVSTRAVFAAGVLRLISDTAIAPGTQAFINYGHSENLVFATHYGMSPHVSRLHFVSPVPHLARASPVHRPYIARTSPVHRPYIARTSPRLACPLMMKDL
jgi:hypothetical protein